MALCGPARLLEGRERDPTSLGCQRPAALGFVAHLEDKNQLFLLLGHRVGEGKKQELALLGPSAREGWAVGGKGH